MSFLLYRENQLEKLAELFVRNVYTAGADPNLRGLLASDIVVVQTRGMAEYLRQYIALQCGIAANLEMPFFNSFIDRIFRSLYGDSFIQAARRSEQKNIRRELMKIFCNARHNGTVPVELQKYLCGVNPELKAWQLAGKLADLFDQYQIYRCDELANGSLFAPGDWQGGLYKQLFNDGNWGRNDFFVRFLHEGVPAGKSAVLPESVSIFGVGTLPPVYLNILVKLSEYCRINFFYLTPCMEYWEFQKARKEQRLEPWNAPEAGNPILQELGRQGRCFFSTLLADERIAPAWDSSLRQANDDPGSTMLEVMQNDILYLFDRRKLTETEPAAENSHVGDPKPELAKDRSISIHNCHSIRRELEVLHDELLKLIQQGIKPQDIIVMAPDIVRCAPVIDAVFGSGALRNVYSIADLPPGSNAMAFEAFHRIFEVASGRFEYSEVMALLDLPFIAGVLRITPENMISIGELLQDSGVRWGFDGAMRKHFCQNGFDEFSWQMAMDRLLAGFACRSNDSTGMLLGGVKSYEALEGGELESFAKVVKLLEKLAQLAERINSKLDMATWLDIFRQTGDDFLGNGNEQRTALAPLREALSELEKMIRDDCLPGVYPLNAALAILDELWQVDPGNGRFLRGKITFCRMVPMRSIPMDVVAILDLNEGDFPRRTAAGGFDLIAADSRASDRSQPVQDRYLLLEALMAARKNLLLFYQGRSALNNQEKPPCAPLSEIMNYLHNAFDLKEIKHKLSGIDPYYFKPDGECNSLDMENFRAVKSLQKRLSQAGGNTENVEVMPPFWAGMDLSGDIELSDLAAFFNHPCRWLVRNQLGLYLRGEADSAGDEEPWNLAAKDNWKIDNMFIDMAQCSDDILYTHALRGNLLPPGNAGRKDFDRRAAIARNLPEVWRRRLENMCRLPLSCLLPGAFGAAEKSGSALPAPRISGMVNMSADQQEVLVFNLSSYKSQHALEAVLGVIVAALALNRPVGARLLNLSRGEYELRCIDPVTPAEAGARLHELLLLASENYEIPPPLFPRASVYWDDLSKAARSFASWSFSDKKDTGDATDLYVKKFYRSDAFTDEEFVNGFQQTGQLLYGWIKSDCGEVGNE